MDFLTAYRRWHDRQERFRAFFAKFRLDPDGNPDSIAAEYVRRSPEERARIVAAWGDLLDEDLLEPEANSTER
jgi:hypothetical protein